MIQCNNCKRFIKEEDATTSSKYYPEILCIDCFFEEEDEAENEISAEFTSAEIIDRIVNLFATQRFVKNAKICKRR